MNRRRFFQLAAVLVALPKAVLTAPKQIAGNVCGVAGHSVRCRCHLFLSEDSVIGVAKHDIKAGDSLGWFIVGPGGRLIPTHDNPHVRPLRPGEKP